MNRRVCVSIIFILIVVLCFTALFACNDNDDGGNNLANRTLKSISVEGVDKDNPITLVKGEAFVPGNYKLRIVLDNDAEFTVDVNNGMFRVASELELVNQVGTHSLTVTYSLNNSELNTLLYIVVKEPEVVRPKYNVTFDMGGVSYAEQLRDRTVDTLSTPSVTYIDPTMSYMTAEWYTTSTYASSSKVAFPLTVTADVKLYAKWVDNRRITVEYYVMRMVDGNIVNASGDATTRDMLVAESSMTKTGLKVYGAVISGDPAPGLVTLNPVPTLSVTGYSFAREWQVYNYDTDSYETVTRDSLGDKYDFHIDECYLADKSALSSTIKMYCVYNINSYTIAFDQVYDVYALTKSDTLTASDGKVTIDTVDYRVDEFDNVVVNNVNYHVVGSDVYTMAKASTATINVTAGRGDVTVDGTTYYVNNGILYRDGEYINAIGSNLIMAGTTPAYYVHTPHLSKTYNYQLTADNIPYILDKVDQTGSWQIAGVTLTYPYYVRGDVTLTANYVDKTYPVAFYRYTGALMGTVTKKHASKLVDRDFDGISLGNLSGYTYIWKIDGTPYTTSDLYDIEITAPIDVYEERTPLTYTNTFYFVDGGVTKQVAEIETSFAEFVAEHLPAAEQIAAVASRLSNAYYAFEWYTDADFTSTGLVTSATTQGDVDGTYYLKAIDRRTLVLTITIPEQEALDLDNRTAIAQSIAIGKTYTISPAGLGLRYLTQYETDVDSYTVDGQSIPAIITFNDAFVSTYNDYMDYDSVTFVYSAEIITPGKTKTFTVRFKDELYNTTLPTTVEYGTIPVYDADGDGQEDYDTAARTVEGKAYHFAGWYNESHNKYYAAFEPATTDNMTYCAVWRSEEEGSFDIVYTPYRYNGAEVASYAMTGYKGYTTDVYVGNTYEGLPVEAIMFARDAQGDIISGPFELDYDNETAIKLISIPSTVQYIEEGVFVECYFLEEIVVDSDYFVAIDGVLYQKNTASDYTLLAYPAKKVDAGYTVHANTIRIAADAFSMYLGTSIDLGSVVEIGDRAFKNAALTTIDIPTTVTTIGAEAFRKSALTTVNVLSTTISKVGENAFADTTWLAAQSTDTIMLGNVLLLYKGDDATYTIASTVYAIADKAFYKRTALTTLTIAGGSLDVSRIGARVFDYCASLATIVVPDDALRLEIEAHASTIFVNTTIYTIVKTIS